MDNLTILWQQYTQQGDRQARESLILHYSRLVHYVVARLGVGLPPSLQREDLISYGVVGLIAAVDRFDPQQGVKFETYAATRIRGQIIDSLRAMDVLPRSVYRHTRAIERALTHLTQILQRTPDETELAAFLNISLEQYQQWLADSNFALISLDQPLSFEDGEESSLYNSVEDSQMPSPAQQFDDQELKQGLLAAVKALPQREQLIVSLYYNDGLTMKEIGEVLNISESRVSQLHARIVLGLRSVLKHQFEPNSSTHDARGNHRHAVLYPAFS